jgi:uncharacterized C2H2 Zn-finger protein
MFEISLANLATLYVGVFFAGILIVVLAAAAARRRQSAPGPPVVRCHLCAMTFQPTEDLTRCPRCGALNERPLPRRRS